MRRDAMVAVCAAAPRGRVGTVLTPPFALVARVMLAVLVTLPALGCGDSSASPAGVGRPGDASLEGGPSGRDGGGDGSPGGGSGGGGSGSGGASADAGMDAGAPLDKPDAELDVDAGPERLVAQAVGPGGGIVVAQDLTLSFPVGALDSVVEVTVDRGTLGFPAGLKAVTPRFELGPSELTFARPVVLCLTGDDAPGKGEQAIVLHTALGKSAFEVATGCKLQAGSQVTRCCPILHFSSTGMANGPTCDASEDLCNDGICRSSCGTRCKAGTTRCGGVCAPLDAAPSCGYCGHECTGGHTCDAVDRICVCPDDASFECQGTCTVDRDACLAAMPCDAAMPFRCPDTTCAASLDACDGTCPSETPYECDSGYCVASMSECGFLPCPEGTKFLCYDGVTCSELDGAQCPSPVTCPEDAPVRCSPGGTCGASLAQCPSITPCPEFTPYQCASGYCVTDPSECASYPCPEGKPMLCGDAATCVLDPSACP